MGKSDDEAQAKRARGEKNSGLKEDIRVKVRAKRQGFVRKNDEERKERRVCSRES